VLLAVGLTTPSLSAQRMPPGGGGRQDREQLERRVRARFAETMQRRLGLTHEQSQRLSEVVDALQGERRSLGRDERALRTRMEAILTEEGTSDADAREVLLQMEELRLREARLFQTEQERMLEVLTPVQVVRFHAMREQLAARIQQLRGGPPGPGRRPGGMDLDDGGSGGGAGGGAGWPGRGS
jgi:Spy/CpxP family protein refolding chaperone